MKFYLNLPLGRHGWMMIFHSPCFPFCFRFQHTSSMCWTCKKIKLFYLKGAKRFDYATRGNTFLAIVLKISCNNCIPWKKLKYFFVWSNLAGSVLQGSDMVCKFLLDCCEKCVFGRILLASCSKSKTLFCPTRL